VTSIFELVGFSDNVIINLDFADVSAVMKDAGRAHMGVGSAAGREKAEQAATAAVSSPLLETSINGATGVLVNVTGSSEMTLDDVETAAGIVQEAANPDANIIFGATCCDDFQDEMRVTVIATGFELKPQGFAANAEASAENQDAQANESQPENKPGDMGDIDEIFKIFSR
jgi:cell division protein FtsZ